MKNRVLKAGLYGMVLFLTGAVAVSTVDKLYIEPRTVSSWSDLVDCYLVDRTSLPPLPLAFEDVFSRMGRGDWSFLADHWQIRQAGGTFYVAEKSKLAKHKLPLHIQVFEDLQRGDIIILSSTDGINFQGEALFKAPEFMPYEKEVSLDRYAYDELAPRRILWEITLKSEADAWGDLMTRSAPASAESEIGNLQSTMSRSVPAAHTNDLWLHVDRPSGIDITIYAPDGFTNRVEIFSTDNLVSNDWQIAAQNLLPVYTNPVVWAPSLTNTTGFFRAGNMDIDSDGDGIPDARERFIYKTDPYNADTDGDGMPDGWEIEHGFNPLLYADGGFDFDSDGLTNAEEYHHGTDPLNPDTDGDGMPDGWEVAHGLNPLIDDSADDPDGDAVSNLQEYLNGTHPQVADVNPPLGASGSLIFRYDDDGRLTESHLNGQSSELFSLSPAHNVESLDVFTTGN